MKRDFDYVTMADYNHDMKETADQAVAVIETMKQRRDEWQRGLIAATIASGGRLVITQDHLRKAYRVNFEIAHNLADDTLVLTTKEKNND